MASRSVGSGGGTSSSSSEMTIAGSCPLSRTTCLLRSSSSLMTASRTACRSMSSRARKCSAAGAVCAGSISSRMQCSVAAART
eukprot:7454950-Alexandrium_andersonii.AAC.1